MKLPEIKKLIKNEVQSECPDWNTIKQLANDAVIIEDNEGEGYSHDGALYGITCPNCGAKWLIPFLETYKCENCNNNITIDWSNK